MRPFNAYTPLPGVPVSLAHNPSGPRTHLLSYSTLSLATLDVLCSRMDRLLHRISHESGFPAGQWSWQQNRASPRFHPASLLVIPIILPVRRLWPMAVVRALQTFERLDIYCDNVGVVRNLLQILEHGFHFIDWRNHPISDLWSHVAALIVSRQPNCVTITKVKSHRSLPEHAPEDEKWKTRGTDFADSRAKDAVKRYLDLEIPNFRAWIQDEEIRLIMPFGVPLSCMIFPTIYFLPGKANLLSKPPRLLWKISHSRLKSFINHTLSKIPWMTLVSLGTPKA